MTSTTSNAPTLGPSGLAIKCRLFSPVALLGLFCLLTISTLIYTLAEWLTYHHLVSPWLPPAIILSGGVLCASIHIVFQFVRHHIHSCYMDLRSTDQSINVATELTRLNNTVFNYKHIASFGLTYACLFVPLPFIFDIWSNDLLLRLLTASVLFFYQILPGMAVFAVATFFLYLVRMALSMSPSIWNKDIPALYFLLGSAIRIALLTTVYTSTSVLVIILTPFPHGSFVASFSIYGLVVMLVYLLTPTAIIRHKFSRQKRVMQSHIGVKLEEEFERLMESNEQNDHSDKRWEQLIKVRDVVEGLPTTPFRVQVFGTSFSMIVIAIIPTIMQELFTEMLRYVSGG